MYFEGRELPDHAEPISANDLQEGKVYFAVNYVDDEMLIPVMETIVFIGRNLEEGDEGQVYFQDIESHRAGVSYDWESDDGPAKFQCGSEHELNHIFDYEHALEVLMRCSLRRAKQ
jgi:hypothetical protein